MTFPEVIEGNDCLHNSVRLDEDVLYFLFVGPLRATGLLEYVQNNMSKRTGRRVSYVAMMPDVVESYPSFLDEFVVVNPEAQAALLKKQKNQLRRQKQTGKSSPRQRQTPLPTLALGKFYSIVSENETCKNIVNRLLERQGELDLIMWSSSANLKFHQDPRVHLIGPEPSIARQANNKAWQYKTLAPHIPVVDFRVCEGRNEMLQTVREVRPEWKHGVFVTLPFSAAGSNSMVTHEDQEVETHFHKDETYLITKYTPHRFDPSIVAVVANENEVFVGGVADQIIEHGNSFRGSTFPTVLPVDAVTKIMDYTRTVGQVLARHGFRGIYGCDFIVDDQGEVFFIEINARKTGSTLYTMCATDYVYSPDTPNLLEMEYMAVTEGRLPEVKEITFFDPETTLHWGTYFCRSDARIVTSTYIHPTLTERELFRKVKEYNKGDSVVFDHVGSNISVEYRGIVARIVAVDLTREGVLKLLEDGSESLKHTLNLDLSEPGDDESDEEIHLFEREELPNENDVEKVFEVETEAQ
eukprot:gb/GECH01012456.1/.p1 GENE.gb/GECH01012456.1/~~gb/GECH01012456.1/.p1  ORF type:complete len:525 (+),score=153.43 gb/GECH01012456.1/:1-1575(+)